jgi:polyphosphate kinase
VDPEVIEALYRASQAGVEIRLLVRGVCCLRAKVPGVSDNITVRSIVGRFLEHSRIYRFENGGNPELYLASADWMARNFFRRVETCFPIEDPDLRAQIDLMLDAYWRDNVRAREQGPDPTYIRRSSNGDSVDSQGLFLEGALKKKPDIDSKPLVVKTAANMKELARREDTVGQPA